jgi:hypothetical protein
MMRLRFGLISLAVVAGCSSGMHGHSAVATPDLDMDAAPADSVNAPIVQVRGFPGSSLVTVVAWDDDDAEAGLRSSVNRDGVVVGQRRFGDHILNLNFFYARSMGGFKYATDPQGHLLLPAAMPRDVYSCYYGNRCSPIKTLGVEISDSLLRANRDSLVVTFVPSVGDPWKFTVRRELIAAYLTRIDSVVGAMRRTATY